MEKIIRRSVRVVTPPAFEPVTLAEAKLWLRIDDDDTDEDATVLMIITAIGEYAEELTGRAFVARTLELRLDGFPEGEIELPFAPLRSVSSIDYLDADGVLQSLDVSPTGWQEDTASQPGRVAPLVNTDWPATSDEMGSVRITYNAGYASPNAIPRLARLWMQARISTLFEQREQLVVGGQVSDIPRDFVDGLLDGLRVRKFFA